MSTGNEETSHGNNSMHKHESACYGVIWERSCAQAKDSVLSEVLLVDEIARKFPSSGRVYTSSSVSTLLNSAAGHS